MFGTRKRERELEIVLRSDDGQRPVNSGLSRAAIPSTFSSLDRVRTPHADSVN
jgi:hypothetical protein